MGQLLGLTISEKRKKIGSAAKTGGQRVIALDTTAIKEKAPDKPRNECVHTHLCVYCPLLLPDTYVHVSTGDLGALLSR